MIQSDALNILKSGRNVYLTGAAGSGKTYVLNQYIQHLKERGVSVAVTASTGIAATHIGGMTIHSWSGMGIKDGLSEYDIELLTQKEHLWKRYDKTRVLILDEVSMIGARMFDSLDRLARAMRGNDAPFGGIQVVLSGDFFQLPPIVKGGGPVQYVDSARAWTEMDVRVCYLEEQHRQDDMSLENILSEIRSGEISYRTQEIFQEITGAPRTSELEPTRLYTHNVDVDAVNNAKLKELPGELHSYKMTTRGKGSVLAGLCKSILAPEELQLKKDAVVMFVKNNFEEGYVNGTLGKVVDFEDGMPVVETYDGKRINAAPATWEVEDDGKILAAAEQLPLRLAWAITVHKSQGMSLDAAEIDLSRSFVPGQGYVALSRLRTLEGLTLLGLNRMALEVDPYVSELNRKLLQDSSKWSQVIKKFSDDDFKKMHEEFVEQCGGTNDPEVIEKNKAFEAEEAAPKVATHEKTFALLKEGKTLKEAAKERGMTMSTIIAHLEKLKSGGYEIDLSPYKPKKADLDKIKAAFEELGDTKLAPAHQKLKGKYTYEDLRLARLFI